MTTETETTTQIRHKPEHALFSTSFPCNPIPFANRIIELVRENGTDAISSPESQYCLMVLLQQSYGQMKAVDPFHEFLRLEKILVGH